MSVLAEYQLEPGGRWLTVIGAPGDTYDELAAALRRLHGAVDVRPRELIVPPSIAELERMSDDGGPDNYGSSSSA